MNIAIIAEHDNEKVKLSTLSAINAAQKFSGSCSLFLLGVSITETLINYARKIEGVDSIIVIESESLKNNLSENIVECLLESVSTYGVILSSATVYGKNFMPRLAAKLNVNAYSDVIDIKSSDVYVRPTYAGNVLQTVKSFDAIKVLTIRATAFEPAALMNIAEIPVVKKEWAVTKSLNEYINSEKNPSERPEITEASIIVSGGRGLQSREQFTLIAELADKLGAAVGASRAAVDAGFISNDHQIGQTGKIVAPELYIAIGISGAIQHLAGIKDSKIIVAINKDPEAPIFQIATYGLVGNAFELVPELINKL